MGIIFSYLFGSIEETDQIREDINDMIYPKISDEYKGYGWSCNNNYEDDENKLNENDDSGAVEIR